MNLRIGDTAPDFEAETTEGQAAEAPAESPEVTRLVELAKAGDEEAFAGLMRAGVIPESVCLECADISARLGSA